MVLSIFGYIIFGYNYIWIWSLGKSLGLKEAMVVLLLWRHWWPGSHTVISLCTVLLFVL